MPKVRIAFTGDDPKKPSPYEIMAANRFAKDFARRKGLVIAQDAHVGNAVPKFIDATTGKEATVNAKLPPNTVTDIRQLPSYVKADNLVKGQDGLSYFENQVTGDMTPIHPDIVRSKRLNPNRGKTNLLSYAKL